jgi:ubiquinone/menaquinone biosynthesis C-methylase UbiE
MAVSSSDTRFTGDVPRMYDRHLAPVCLAPHADDLADRVPYRPALRVLETACGTGVATRPLLERLPYDGRLVATDLNESMLEVFHERVPDDPRLEWRVADAQALPDPDASFDVVACQFGMMFLPDKSAGMREARRVLRPGGTFVFNTWMPFEHNPAQRAAHELVARFFDNDPPVFYDVPFGWNDASGIRRALLEAGFRDVRLTTVKRTGTCPSHRSLAVGCVRGNPIVYAIQERGGDVDAVIAALERRFAELWPSEPFTVPLLALVVEATA